MYRTLMYICLSMTMIGIVAIIYNPAEKDLKGLFSFTIANMFIFILSTIEYLKEKK